jgi:hypothetical protein
MQRDLCSQARLKATEVMGRSPSRRKVCQRFSYTVSTIWRIPARVRAAWAKTLGYYASVGDDLGAIGPPPGLRAHARQAWADLWYWPDQSRSR